MADPRFDCSFTNELHNILESISDDRILQEYEKFDALLRLARDFKTAALAYGKIIISEKFLPEGQKTIEPVTKAVGGIAGGEKVCLWCRRALMV
jgi:hypothetical protein